MRNLFLNSFFRSFISCSGLCWNWFLVSDSILQSTLASSLITLRCKFWRIPNSCSSISPSFKTFDTLISNTAIADVMMSTNFVTLVSFLCYLEVSPVATPRTLTPARETAPNGILTGKPMKVLRVATLDIPEATLRLLEQVFIHINQSNTLEYLEYFFAYLSFSFNNPCCLLWIMFWGSKGAESSFGRSGYNL